MCAGHYNSTCVRVIMYTGSRHQHHGQLCWVTGDVTAGGRVRVLLSREGMHRAGAGRELQYVWRERHRLQRLHTNPHPLPASWHTVPPPPVPALPWIISTTGGGDTGEPPHWLCIGMLSPRWVPKTLKALISLTWISGGVFLLLCSGAWGSF